MRVIVPLQGVVQGRGGLFLGSVIPCALFYFLQLYLKRFRNDPGDPNDPSSSSPTQNTASSVPSRSSSSGQLTELPGLPRSLSRPLLSPRNVGGGPACVAGRVISILKTGETPCYVGLKQVEDDPYDEVGNPGGVIQLGLAQNKVLFFSFLFFLGGWGEEQRRRKYLKNCFWLWFVQVVLWITQKLIELFLFQKKKKKIVGCCSCRWIWLSIGLLRMQKRR